MYYTIDLETIMQLLCEFQRSGVLQAELPLGLLRLKQTSIAVIMLSRGEVTACYVKDTRGQTLLVDQEAFQTISAAGKLNWVFDTSPGQELPDSEQHFHLLSDPSSQASTPMSVPKLRANFPRASPVPRPLVQLNYAEINAWPRRYRQVYGLIDGVRSVAKIAEILSQPPQLVEEILRDIEATGAIYL